MHALDQAPDNLKVRHRQSQVALLGEGMKLDILRPDEILIAHRIKRIVTAKHPTDQPAWQPTFQRLKFFSLTGVIELARRMVEDRACDGGMRRLSRVNHESSAL